MATGCGLVSHVVIMFSTNEEDDSVGLLPTPAALDSLRSVGPLHLAALLSQVPDTSPTACC